MYDPSSLLTNVRAKELLPVFFGPSTIYLPGMEFLWTSVGNLSASDHEGDGKRGIDPSMRRSHGIALRIGAWSEEKHEPCQFLGFGMGLGITLLISWMAITA